MHTLTEALTQLRNGKAIIVIDHPSRENEGDFVAAAQFATPELINFMITEGKGLVCVPLPPEYAERLNLKPMVAHTHEPYRCNFTVSVDAAHGITTGISAADRTHTIRLLAKHDSTANDFVQPGHVFPLIAKERGVLAREGHTEATVDLLKLAGVTPVGVICEILNRDGTMARGTELEAFAKKHSLPLLAIDDLIKHLKAAR